MVAQSRQRFNVVVYKKRIHIFYALELKIKVKDKSYYRYKIYIFYIRIINYRRKYAEVRW